MPPETIECKHCQTRNTWTTPESWPRCGGCGRPIGRVMSPKVLRAYAKLASVAKNGLTIELTAGTGQTVKIDAAGAKRIKANVNAELRRQKLEGP